jgi:hypothetical protein
MSHHASTVVIVSINTATVKDSMKLRWSNNHNFAFEFEANDPDSFYEQAFSALRSFRISQHKRVHRGEIHKTVVQCEACSLHVYDGDNGNWYSPAGEAKSIDTQSFGTISIKHHFNVQFDHLSADSLADLQTNLKFSLISFDPIRVERLDLRDRTASDRIWNLCIGVYQQSRDMNAFIMNVGDAIDKHLDQNMTTDQVLEEVNKRLSAAGREPISRRRLLAIAKYEHDLHGIGRQISRGTWLFAREEIDSLMPVESGHRRTK